MTDDKSLKQRLEEVPGWSLTDEGLSREYVFDDFVAAWGFMSRVALIAQALNHHPDWSNSYNHVSIKLFSHSAGRVTAKDLELAEGINQLV